MSPTCNKEDTSLSFSGFEVCYLSTVSASCFLLPAFSLLPPISCFLLSAYCHLSPASCFQPTATHLLLPASCFLLSAYCHLSPASCFYLLVPVPVLSTFLSSLPVLYKCFHFSVSCSFPNVRIGGVNLSRVP